MPSKSEYAQGTPNWVDLQTSNQSAAKEFYSALFGWSYDDQTMREGQVYSMATIEGSSVAAIAPQQPDAVAAGVPPTWNTYIAVDDVDKAVEAVGPAGGQVLMPAFDVMDAGRMTFVSDPTGAVVGLWQAKGHIGATLIDEAGTVLWNELNSDGLDKALAFYGAVVGITTSTMEMGPDTYTLLNVGSDQVGGATAPQMPGVPNHWHVYFAVDDTDASAAKVVSLGWQVVAEPFDIPTVGRMAMVSDPQGAVFSVMTPEPAQDNS